jgi:plastocyanin
LQPRRHAHYEGKKRMHKLLLIASALVSLVLAGPVAAATIPVSITKNGFSPKTAQVVQGDTVTWTNADTANHQVIGDGNEFTSPVLKTGGTFSFTVTTTNRLSYHDGLDKKNKASLNVKAAAQPAPAGLSVTLLTSSPKVTFGSSIRLSGIVSSHKAGESVTILGRPFESNAFAKVTTVTTVANGAWSFAAKPTIQTSYQADWKRAVSAAITIGVRPKVAFNKLAGGRFFTKATAVRAFAGKYVQVQRRSGSRWITVKRVRLGGTSSATFRVTLPRGTSSVRVAMSVNQAGTGYLAGLSRTLSVSR